MRLADAAILAIAVGGAAYVAASSSGSSKGGGAIISVPQTPVNVEGMLKAMSQGFENLAKGQINMAEYFGKQISELSKGQLQLSRLYVESNERWIKALERITSTRFKAMPQLENLKKQINNQLNEVKKAKKARIIQPKLNVPALPSVPKKKIEEAFRTGFKATTPLSILAGLGMFARSMAEFQDWSLKQYSKRIKEWQNLGKRIFGGGAGGGGYIAGIGNLTRTSIGHPGIFPF